MGNPDDNYSPVENRMALKLPVKRPEEGRQ